ncbi:acetyl-CoA carboxylase carboxyltransferase subunit alpha [Acetitomaculum ruminis DSM 5522]|uniref:acetyl-CoA carboxytransferase n=1 Tax=Acetitomaculum ruminis DSM 5522 TaxID=1120918 RepID=A0A1I0ZRL5_9FIRM|nr:acetyl-CoA carboxylase carboxyl transferase subunit alpha [Acetitomaculum ruminis]SFB26998.1 acetyl-CoA carboxylase carboxyltransferase subunit alpha [Acetitomaculum ruminis DSM 5522]
MSIIKNKSDFDIVLSARSEKRFTAKDYIYALITDFMEFHGDRYYGDDKAIIGGIGYLLDMPLTVIGIEKGKTIEERILHNFGSAHPEGYRKALRLMKQAEKFNRPVLCFVDTAGAYCGVDAEERGQGRAIAVNLAEMSDLKVPIISIVIGEGGSGGALALCHSDRIWMMEDAYFSVVSPESCANILWKDPKKADVAASALCLTANKLSDMGLIDKICKKKRLKELLSALREEYKQLMSLSSKELIKARYERFRKVGY